jgi:formyl-CoA transferase
MTDTALPLTGVRVVELGHFIAAPFCTRVMADMGADVIKVEPPVKGDPVRRWGMQVDGKAPWWSLHGRNKKSLTLNLKHPKAREIVLSLVATAEIVVENFRPGQLESFGLGPEDLAKARPGIVLVRISGYGQTGPEKARASFGVIGEAQGGLRYLCDHPPGTSDLPPVRTGISIGDSVAGLYGVGGALAALIRQRAEGGTDARVVDVALNESVFTLLEGSLPEYSYDGTIRQPTGSTLPTNAPSNAYRSSDGVWVLIAANSDPLFARLSRLIGRPDLPTDPRYADNPSRVAHARDLDMMIGDWAAEKTAAEITAAMEKADIPCTRVATIADCAKDPQFIARDMVHDVTDPNFGTLSHPGAVPVFGGIDRKAAVRWTGSDVGEHTAELLAELGLAEEEITALKEENLI